MRGLNFIKVGLAIIIALSSFQTNAQTTLWGVTSGGGPSNGFGVLFQIDPATGAYAVRHSFSYTNAYSPGGPQGSPVSYNGKLWGTTSTGGDSAVGTIYSYDPATSTYSSLFSFSNNRGANPRGEMIVHNGKLWGVTTTGGGFATGGVLYSYDPATGVYTKEHGFTDAIPAEGNALVVYNNKLYGMTAFAGTGSGGGGGTLYEYTPASGVYTVLHNFNYPADPNGCSGFSTPVVYNNKLYAQMQSGGANGFGTIFSYDPANGNIAVLHDNAAATGGSGQGSLLVSGNTMYGMLDRYAINDGGALFSIDLTTGSFTSLYKFDTAVAYSAQGTPLLYNNKLYGMNGKGPNTWGGLFSYDLATSSYTLLHSFSLATGAGTRASGHLIPLNVPMPTAVRSIGTKEDAVLLWPNPMGTELRITCANADATIMHLLDITGRVVLSSALQPGTTTIDTRSLSQGVYVYRVLDGNGALLQYGKLIKQ